MRGDAELVTVPGFGEAPAHLRSVADKNGNTKEKLFELLAQAFLMTDRMYIERFDEAWLRKDYPGRDGLIGPGIDLAAREKRRLNMLHPVQVL